MNKRFPLFLFQVVLEVADIFRHLQKKLSRDSDWKILNIGKIWNWDTRDQKGKNISIVK
jgi:hypothetical protein